MTRTAGLLAAAVVLAVAAVLRVRAYRRNRSPRARDLAIGLGSLALAVTIYAPPVYRALDRVVFHRANTSELAGHLSVVLSAGAALGMVATLVRHGTVIRAVLGGYAVASAVGMTATFLSHRFPAETTDFTTVYGGQLDVRLYWTIFLAYALVLLTTLAVITARADVEARWLRRGLRLISAGAVFGDLYMIHWAIDVALLASGRHTSRAVDSGSLAFAVVGSVLIAVGTSLPSGGPRVRQALALRRIGPIWREITGRYPEVRTEPDSRADRLLRVDVEIRDGVTEARIRGQLDTPLLRELDALPARDLVEFDEEIRQLESVARRLRRGELGVRAAA